jgi:uncharacterized protein (TIGR02757 family)
LRASVAREGSWGGPGDAPGERSPLCFDTVRPSPSLGPRLADLARRYDRSFLDSDPIRWAREYDDPADREVAAVVAALCAYGRVQSIHRSVSAALSTLGPRPAGALARAVRGGLEDRLAGWRHRWTCGEDLAWALRSVAVARDEAGSLGRFLERAAEGDEPLRAALSAWRRLADAVPASDAPARRRARAFLLPNPAAGGACKRTLLLARWCLRPDDGVDLGIWAPTDRLAPRHLLIPLDTHVHRVALDLGLTRRRVPSWAAAREVTEALARYDADDPARFDFALVRPGILGKCRHRHVPDVCGPCELKDCCRHGRPRGKRAARVVAAAATRRSRTSGSSGTTPSPRRRSGTPAP